MKDRLLAVLSVPIFLASLPLIFTICPFIYIVVGKYHPFWAMDTWVEWFIEKTDNEL